MKCFDMYRKTLPNLIHSIEEYKWLESEKAGYDIGENEASKRWIKSYYREWFLQHVS